MQSRTTRERSAARHTEEPVARSDNRHGGTTAATFPLSILLHARFLTSKSGSRGCLDTCVVWHFHAVWCDNSPHASPRNAMVGILSLLSRAEEGQPAYLVVAELSGIPRKSYGALRIFF